jgi:hypothetical protein
MLAGAEGRAVFEVEFVIVHAGDHPEIVEKMSSGCSRLIDADATAKSLLDGVRGRHPQNPPDGYQLRDNNGNVVLRSWEIQRSCPEDPKARSGRPR